MRTDFHFTCLPPHGWLFITGELDLSTHDRLQDTLDSLWLRGCTDLEIDTTGVDHIDSHTLGILYREQHRMRASGGDLLIGRASPIYRLVSRLAGYTTLEATGTAPAVIAAG